MSTKRVSESWMAWVYNLTTGRLPPSIVTTAGVRVMGSEATHRQGMLVVM